MDSIFMSGSSEFRTLTPEKRLLNIMYLVLTLGSGNTCFGDLVLSYSCELCLQDENKY